MSLAPGTKLGPYEISSQLGSGGMGVVYEATDPRLKRTVAIKLLPPDLVKDATAKQRFLQEAQAASALDHPNICTIHDVGETDDGQLYLVMAHYEGETLKERIERGPLDLDDAIDIATQVGQGLAEAHQAGIVHRDIKPANLFVTKSGAVKILDFGLAKLAGSEGVTQTGTTVGTVAYMSPEQARGQEVDHRTDIWSLGVVLYEMLAGTPPFQGENLLSLADAIRAQEPEPLTGKAASAFGPVSRALSKEAASRYASVTGLVKDLKSGVTTPAPVIAVQPDIPSIAVLPFADMSPEKDQDYFCEGMAEEIINALTKLEGLKVASRTSAFQFKDGSQDVRRIGDALNVKTVLEGSVRTAGDRLRVMVQLVNIADGYHLWSERYDRQMEDVFSIQDEISLAIAEALKIQLVGDTARPQVTRHTEDLDAYHLYLQGRHQWFSRYRGGLEKALRYFEQAIEKDPSYAAAHAGVAQAYTIFGLYGFLPPKVAFPKAKVAVKRAGEGKSDIAEAHTAAGMISMVFDWDWEAADQQFQRAIALEPANTLALSWRALNLGMCRRDREAMSAITRARELDPLSAYARTIEGMVLMLDGQHRDALEVLEGVLNEEPNFILALWMCGGSYSALSLHEKAVDRLHTLVHLTDRLPIYVGMLGQALARGGRRAEAETLLEELGQRAEAEYVPPVTQSWIAMALGDSDRAAEWLEQEYLDRGIFLFSAKAGPWFDDFRPDPRFQALLRKMNFPPRT